jgi:hypothetical protein
LYILYIYKKGNLLRNINSYFVELYLESNVRFLNFFALLHVFTMRDIKELQSVVLICSRMHSCQCTRRCGRSCSREGSQLLFPRTTRG